MNFVNGVTVQYIERRFMALLSAKIVIYNGAETKLLQLILQKYFVHFYLKNVDPSIFVDHVAMVQHQKNTNYQHRW